MRGAEEVLEAHLVSGGFDYLVKFLTSSPPLRKGIPRLTPLKGASAYRLRAQQFAEVQKKLWGQHFWSPSYCAVSCGGAALETVRL